MAYSQVNSKGQTYYLHMKDVTLKGGRLQRIYFFARDVRIGSCDALPEGYTPVENPKTGLVVLKKIRQPAEQLTEQPTVQPAEQQ